MGSGRQVLGFQCSRGCRISDGASSGRGLAGDSVRLCRTSAEVHPWPRRPICLRYRGLSLTKKGVVSGRGCRLPRSERGSDCGTGADPQAAPAASPADCLGASSAGTLTRRSVRRPGQSQMRVGLLAGRKEGVALTAAEDGYRSVAVTRSTITSSTIDWPCADCRARRVSSHGGRELQDGSVP